MTREEAKELLPIIHAFAEGKIIQDKIEGFTDWCDTDDIDLEYEGQKIKYRIKPEPKYRPFKSQEECWSEILKHQPFGWLKDSKVICHIDEIYCDYINVNGSFLTHSQVFNNYEFFDGTPFGIKDE